MNISDIIAILAFVIPASGAVVSFILNNRRTKRQATLDAFNVLQEQALDQLNQLTKTDYQRIADARKRTKEVDPNDRNGKTRYNEIRTLLARCEHFAVGVYTGIYDKHVVKMLTGVYLQYLFLKVSPVIDAARSAPDGKESYQQFERLVKELSGKNKDAI